MKRLLPPRAVRVAAALLVAAGLCVVVGSAPGPVGAADPTTAILAGSLTLTPNAAAPKLVNGQYVVEFTATYKYTPMPGKTCIGFATDVVWPEQAVPPVPLTINSPTCVGAVTVQVHTKTEGIYSVSAGLSKNSQFVSEVAKARFTVEPVATGTPTPKPSATATPKPSATATPTLKPSPTATVKPTIAPTLPPVEPTVEETPTPTAPPTPTAAPSSAAPQTPPASPAIGTPKPDASSESDAQSTSNRQPSSPLPILIVSPIVIGGLGWLIFVAVRRLENS